MSLGLASRPALFTVSIWSARLMFAFLHSLKIRFKWAWVYTAEVNGSMCSCTAGACPNMGMLATAAAPHMEDKQLWYQHSFFCHSDFTKTFRFHYSYWMLDIKRIGNLWKTWEITAPHMHAIGQRGLYNVVINFVSLSHALDLGGKTHVCISSFFKDLF